MEAFVSRVSVGYKVYYRDENGNKVGLMYMNYTRKQAITEFRKDFKLSHKHITFIDV